MSEIVNLPRWKKGATPYERLSELALLAKEHPDMFERFVIVYVGNEPNGNWHVRCMDYKCDLTQILGILQLGIHRTIEDSIPTTPSKGNAS